MIIIKKGDTLRLSFTFKDNNNDDSGIDITDYGIKIQAKVSPASTDTLFDCSIGSGITITNATNGQFELYIQDTTSFSVSTYEVDIQYTDTNNDIKSSNTFQLQIVQDITV
jgi:hypothetical protein